jgi:dienelactone hydrolase
LRRGHGACHARPVRTTEEKKTMNRTLVTAALVLLAAAASAEEKPASPKPSPAMDHSAHHGHGAAAPAARLEVPAGIETRELTYASGGTDLQGFVAWPKKATGKRPGVLVVHEWWGHNQHARTQAIRLAQAGYVGFALDMYGKGKLATHPQDAEAFMKEATADPARLMARFDAALAELKKDPHVDPEKVGAIGYCFGGAIVLAAARGGADLDAVASLHGALAPQNPAQAGAVKARILVATGAADPMVPAEQVAAFRKEMDAAGAKYEVISFPGVKHSFTNPDAGKVGMEALAYDAAADKASWQAVTKLFREAFGS